MRWNWVVRLWGEAATHTASHSGETKLYSYFNNKEFAVLF